MLGSWTRDEMRDLWEHCSQWEEWVSHPVLTRGEDLGRHGLSFHSFAGENLDLSS